MVVLQGALHSQCVGRLAVRCLSQTWCSAWPHSSSVNAPGWCSHPLLHLSCCPAAALRSPKARPELCCSSIPSAGVTIFSSSEGALRADRMAFFVPPLLLLLQLSGHHLLPSSPPQEAFTHLSQASPELAKEE